MKKPEVLILGAGGHAKVIAETIALSCEFSILGFIDDNIEAGTVIFEDKKVLGKICEVNEFANKAEFFIAAVGNNSLREEFFNAAKKYFKPLSVIHPFSFVAKTTVIGDGTVVLPGAIVSSNCIIGKNTIINSRVLIDHDSVIGDHCHIAQGSILGSNVHISSRNFTDIGAVYPSFSKI